MARALGAIKVLRNAVGVGGCQVSLKRPVTKMYGSTLLALRGGVGVEFPEKKHYVTLEWPLMMMISFKK